LEKPTKQKIKLQENSFNYYPNEWKKFKTNKMKIDLYTKTVLTIIAICLTIIVLKSVNIIPNAYGDTPPSNLKNNMNYGLVPLNVDGTIDVNIKSSSTLDVNIVSCESDALRDAGPMKVIIKENEDK